MPQSKLILAAVSKAFRYRGHESIVLDSFEMHVDSNEVVSLVGPSGCGKTTLLNLIAGFITPDNGSITVDGRSVHGPDRTRTMIFQEDAIFPWYTARQNIEYGLRIAHLDSDEREKIVREQLVLFDLEEEKDKYPAELSGGQRKRVDMARAFAISPEIILMDEPFGSLDPLTKENLQNYASKTIRERETTTLFVTHDLEEAIWLSDRIILLTKRPARIRSEHFVPFKRPRELELRFSEEFQALRRELSHELHKENA